MKYFAVYNMYMPCAFIRESTVRSYVHIKETSNEKGRKKVKKDFLIRIDCCAFRWICVPSRPYVSRCIERSQFLLRPFLSMNNNKLCNTFWHMFRLILREPHPACTYTPCLRLRHVYRGMSWSGKKNSAYLFITKSSRGVGGNELVTTNNVNVIRSSKKTLYSFFLSFFCFVFIVGPVEGKRSIHAGKFNAIKCAGTSWTT